ncbi:MAG: hypothetical protein JSV86_17035 [Gemmatimonadota bacterium]|nr:MAG: hypothetical protein JSV86_17035 [Gemmatimonadota bacterium]
MAKVTASDSKITAPFSHRSSGGVTSSAAIGDNQIVRGDGGGTGVQGSLPEINDAGSIIPPADDTLTVGAAAARFASMTMRQLFVHTAPPADVTVQPTGSCGVLVDMPQFYPGEQSVTLGGTGDWALGKVYKYTTGVGTARMLTSQTYGWGGTIVGGYALAYGAGSALIETDISGTLALGRAKCSTAGSSATLRAYGLGSFARGSAYAYNQAARISTGNAFGAYAGGHVNSSTIESNGSGCFAFGAAYYGYRIAAGSLGDYGSFAFGLAETGDIIADGDNCGQFGVGSNTLDDSFQFGNAGLRMKLTDGVPGALQNGDFWVATNDVYVRTGGVSQSLTAMQANFEFSDTDFDILKAAVAHPLINDVGGGFTGAGLTEITSATGSINSIADAGGGDITVTTAANHNLSPGDIVVQYNLADSAYEGFFTVNLTPTPTTYTVTALWGVTDTGSFGRANGFKVPTGGAGTYLLGYSFQYESTAGAEIGLQIVVDEGDSYQEGINRDFQANELTPSSWTGQMTLSDGDQIYMVVTRTTGTNNLAPLGGRFWATRISA